MGVLDCRVPSNALQRRMPFEFERGSLLDKRSSGYVRVVHQNKLTSMNTLVAYGCWIWWILKLVESFSKRYGSQKTFEG